MIAGIENVFGIHESALKIREARQSILANNLANVDTPNYQAQDLDFATALDALSSVDTEALSVSDRNHIAEDVMSFDSEISFRSPTQASLDGNTVDADREKAEFSKNALSHQATLTFMNHQIRTMLMAIRGE